MGELVDLTAERRYRATVRALVDSFALLILQECEASGLREYDWRRGVVRAEVKQYIFRQGPRGDLVAEASRECGPQPRHPLGAHRQARHAPVLDQIAIPPPVPACRAWHVRIHVLGALSRPWK